MSQSDFAATTESVGEWCGREEYAARRWNTHVLPVITERMGRVADTSDAPGCEMDWLHHAVDMAWQAFCSPGGSRAAIRAFNKIANR